MKIKITASKGQTTVLAPRGFAGAITGQGQALYGDSVDIEFKDETGAWDTHGITSIIETMGLEARNVIVGIADPIDNLDVPETE